MSRKTFLTISAIVPFCIGAFILLFPQMFLEEVKHAVINSTALLMARTTGVFLLTISFLNFLVRSHQESHTLKAILYADLALQVMILPLDPLAFMSGTINGIGSFLPNTIIHLLLISGLVYYISKIKTHRT